MDTILTAQIDHFIGTMVTTTEERALLRHVQHSLDERERAAAGIFQALECGTPEMREAIHIAFPDLYRVWEEYRAGGIHALLETITLRNKRGPGRQS